MIKKYQFIIVEYTHHVHLFIFHSSEPVKSFVCYLYSRLSLSRNQRDPQKHFEISVLRHIISVVLRKKQIEQPNFSNDYVI